MKGILSMTLILSIVHDPTFMRNREVVTNRCQAESTFQQLQRVSRQ